MSWNSLHCYNSDLEKDYLWDFQIGDFPLAFSLNLASGYVKETRDTGHPTYTTYTYINTENQDAAIDGNYWETLVVLNGNSQVNIFNASVITGRYTRVNRQLTAGSYGAYDNSIEGPYNVKVASAGAQILDIYLFLHEGHFGPSTTGGVTVTSTPGEPSGVHAYAKKTFNFTVYQQAIAVTRNTSTGAIIADGSTLTLGGLSSTLTLDKSSDRGNILGGTEWQILVQNPTSGAFTAAHSGSDYDLGGGETLLSDTINITWGNLGNYKVVNQCTGVTGNNTGANISTNTFNVQIQASVVVDTITFPNIISVITPIVAPTNITVTSNPVVGVELFQVTVDKTLDTSHASWTQQVGSFPSVNFAPSTQDWLDEIATIAVVNCVVRKGTTLIQSKSGWGPHTFSLSAGTYNIGWEITKKTGTNILYTSSLNNFVIQS